MKIEQIYTGCLSQGAYYIESEGEVAIIDPLRSVTPYLEKAAANNARIKYIFETHFHADFVSGHVTLSKKTGAPIIYGPNATTSFEAIIARDGQVFELGNISITVLHTPGHTLESAVYLLKDATGKDHAIFSGDTLFLGDVGRPDLAQKTGSITADDLAGYLFDSLRNKIMPLADDVIVYPAHGAGSSCGKNLSKETVDTLGNQKATNYALRANMTKEEFIKEVTEGLTPPPQYFPLNVQMNKEGYEDFADVLARSAQALSPAAFESAANDTEAVVLDVRHQEPLLLIAPEGMEAEAITRLSRVGFDQVLGYLKGGFDAWKKASKEYDTVSSIAATTFDSLKTPEEVPVFDVRKEGEFLSEHVVDAQNTPLQSLNQHLTAFPEKATFYVHCAGGYRSMIAASILKNRGIHNFIDIAGGFSAIKETAIPISDFVCPSTL